MNIFNQHYAQIGAGTFGLLHGPMTHEVSAVDDILQKRIERIMGKPKKMLKDIGVEGMFVSEIGGIYRILTDNHVLKAENVIESLQYADDSHQLISYWNSTAYLNEITEVEVIHDILFLANILRENLHAMVHSQHPYYQLVYREGKQS